MTEQTESPTFDGVSEPVPQFVTDAALRSALTCAALYNAVGEIWERDPLQLPPVIWSGLFAQMRIELARMRPDEKEAADD